MSIKFRLLLSYIALLLVPIILTVIVGAFAGLYFIEDVHRSYPGIEKIHTIKQTTTMLEVVFADIKQISLEQPEKLQEDKFLEELEEKLLTFNSALIVRKEGEIIYDSGIFDYAADMKELPRFGEYAYDLYISKDESNKGLKLNQHDFYFSDDSEGSIFIITNTEPARRSFQELINTLMIVIVVIIIITNGTLTYLVAGSIVKPLSKLKDSANRIKEGHLDFQIEVNEKDEIGELAEAFEEMRKRLKNSIDVQHQYEENRKELFSNISHDLKTPITAIKGYVEGIRDGVADTPEKMEKYINTIYAKTVDVDRLIDDLFLFSKLDLNKQPLHLNAIDLSRYFMDLIEELKFDLEEKNTIIEYTNKAEGSTIVMADMMQLKRVVMNIVENAVKYMDKPQGIIEITLSEEKDEMVVQIKDNGQGISLDALALIFDRFYRGDPARNTLTGGSGLGLAIAKKIIEEHDGRMWAESVEGEGSSIFFALKKSKSGDIV